MKEFHAYRNEDGTYKLEVIAEFFKDNEIKEAYIEYPIVNIKSDSLYLQESGELFRVEIEQKGENTKMNKPEIRNAQITSTQLGREDHGIMTFMLFIKIGGSGSCGVGGYALDGYDKDLQQRVFHAKSMEAVSEVLNVVGVDNWEQLPGKYIRVKDNGWGSTIDEVGNLMEDKWFNLREFFSKKVYEDDN